MPDNERIAAGVAYASINIMRPRDMRRAWRSIRVDFCTQESLTRTQEKICIYGRYFSRIAFAYHEVISLIIILSVVETRDEEKLI